MWAILPIIVPLILLGLTFAVNSELYSITKPETYYQGGKKAIKKQLWSKVSADGLPPNGLLTVRFVVNCHGETGLFRANMTDPHVKRIEVPQETSKHFGDLISELKGWVPGKIQGKPLDSYIQIVFKVENGIITDIF